MKQGFRGWEAVDVHAHALIADRQVELNEGQAASLLALTARLQDSGVMLADEVGMGKTRIAAALAHCVVKAGGRVAILAPPGLDDQWRRELLYGALVPPPMLRSLWQFLSAWEDKNAAKPWFKEPVLLLSHQFCGWRLGGKSQAWRWELLPELLAQWRIQIEPGAAPWGYNNHSHSFDMWVRNAARSIVEDLRSKRKRDPAYALASQLATENDPWIHTLQNGAYGKDGALREPLHRATGLGLGCFDLVIIDEAHKSRGGDSMLSTLLEQVLLVPPMGNRRMAMSATPVELDASQWTQSLQRIGVLTDTNKGAVTEAVSAYVEAVAEIRRSPFKEGVLVRFGRAAKDFQEMLAPFVLRRDKREDAGVRRFQAYTGMDINAYRHVSPLRIPLEGLSKHWLQLICAAESLSLVAKQREDTQAKRQWITIGNGHGIAQMADHVGAVGEPSVVKAAPASDEDTLKTKRLERTAWWSSAMRNIICADRKSPGALYQHPALLTAVEEIEAACKQGEKVLVFARYRAPMDALAHLLNARHMLRALKAGKPWPQQTIPDNEWPAVQAAQMQLHEVDTLDRATLSAQLESNYQKLDYSRQRFRNGLLASLEAGMAQLNASTRTMFAGAFAEFKKEHEETRNSGSAGTGVLAAVARALADHLGEELQHARDVDVAKAFADLVQAANNLDPVASDTEDANDIDDAPEIQRVTSSAVEIWRRTSERLCEDYGHNRGGFARLLHGDTQPGTRRLLQLAFNREHAFPQVLIAQSTVGREGLNLHLACRTVMLLHLEWNPAVVEQQIGRVDRLGSRWEQRLDQAIKDGVGPSGVPRIEIRPVIFEGTYDETHWRVLQGRWDELRAQLHGDVLPPCSPDDQEGMELRRRIAEVSPRFFPKRTVAE